MCPIKQETLSVTKNCFHEWRFGGLRYQEGGSRPGTSARDRVYTDWFYCTRCTQEQHRNERTYGTTYDQPLESAIPR
jgi:hypothetical protein